MRFPAITLAACAVFPFGGTLVAQGVTTVQSVDSSGNPGNDSSGSHSFQGDHGIAISADGRVVAFASRATNLVPGDTNGVWDVFVHDSATGITERVSVDSSGAEADSDSNYPAISADGMLVAFGSRATNLVAGDTNGMDDVFVHDRATGVTERVNVDSSGAQADDHGYFPALSMDGRVVAFTSAASNLVAGDTNGFNDVFVHDRVTGVTERVSVDSNGTEANGRAQYSPSISADGNVVAFADLASNLVAGDTNGVTDLFVHDRTSGTTERIDVDSSGNESAGYILEGPSISGDGRIVAFRSDAATLVANDTNGLQDVFVRDRAVGTTERVSVDSAGNQVSGESGLQRISADGRFVTFMSSAPGIVPGDSNRASDVFVRDRVGGFTDCVSVNAAGVPSNWSSRLSVLSADGEVIAFSSQSTDLVPGVLGWQVYARERCNSLASWTNYGAGLAGSFGVPAFTSQSFPAIDSTLALDLANSSGVFTAALLFVGTQRASLHSTLGGDLLLVPSTTVLFVLPPTGVTLSGEIPRDDALCGLLFDFQALELDAGAPKGVSFTAGLELLIGH